VLKDIFNIEVFFMAATLVFANLELRTPKLCDEILSAAWLNVFGSARRSTSDGVWPVLPTLADVASGLAESAVGVIEGLISSFKYVDRRVG
jgi:hypothetical protein